MVMNPNSAIKKGKRLEKWVNEQIEEMGLGRAIRTPGSGSGKLKGDSFNNLPFLLECKNEEQWHWKNIDQAKREAKDGNWDRDKWVLIFKDPRSPEFEQVYAVIDFGEFLELLKKNSEPIVKTPDRELTYLFKNLKEDIRRVLNKIG